MIRVAGVPHELDDAQQADGCVDDGRLLGPEREEHSRPEPRPSTWNCCYQGHRSASARRSRSWDPAAALLTVPPPPAAERARGRRGSPRGQPSSLSYGFKRFEPPADQEGRVRRLPCEGKRPSVGRLSTSRRPCMFRHACGRPRWTRLLRGVRFSVSVGRSEELRGPPRYCRPAVQHRYHLHRITPPCSPGRIALRC